MRARPPHPRVGWRAALVAALTLATAALPVGHAWATPSMIDLPPGESAADWGAALARQGLGEGPGGVEVTVGPDGWHLGLTTSAGRREALVPTPTTRAGRDAVAALAAALLTPSPSVPALPARVAAVTTAAAPVAVAPGASTTTAAAPSTHAQPSSPPTARTPSTTSTEPTPSPAAPSSTRAVVPTSIAPPSTPPASPAAPTLTTAPIAPEATPAPAAPTPEITTTLTTDPAAPALGLSLGVRGASRFHPGLGTTFGGGGDLRLSLSRAWVAIGGGTATEAPLGDGAGGLGASHLGGQLGLRAWEAGRFHLDLGVGAGAQAWRVRDLEGTRVVWSADAESSAAVAVHIWGPAALELGAAGLLDLQEIEVIGSSEAPSRVAVEVFVGIRVGP